MEHLNNYEFYEEIQCYEPPYLQNKHLHNINDDRLTCPSNVNTLRLMQKQPGEYDLTTDLKIREMKL